MDVAIVAEDEHAANAVRGTLESFSLAFERRFGATLSPLVYSRLEAAALAERAPSLWQSIWNDGVTVCGLSVDEWTANE